MLFRIGNLVLKATHMHKALTATIFLHSVGDPQTQMRCVSVASPAAAAPGGGECSENVLQNKRLRRQ